MIDPLHSFLASRSTQLWLRRAFFVAAAFALFMALAPHPPTFSDEPGDKVQHMLAFATLAGLAAAGWRDRKWLGIFVALAGFGGFIEIAQALPLLHRDSELADWFADMAATLASLAVVRGAILRR